MVTLNDEDDEMGFNGPPCYAYHATTSTREETQALQASSQAGGVVEGRLPHSVEKEEVDAFPFADENGRSNDEETKSLRNFKT